MPTNDTTGRDDHMESDESGRDVSGSEFAFEEDVEVG
jgi:hypothetical protein